MLCGQELEAGKMGNYKDLMAAQLGQSISKIAVLLGYFQSAVVSICQNWSKESTMVNQQQAHGFTWGVKDGLCGLIHQMIYCSLSWQKKINAGSDSKISE